MDEMKNESALNASAETEAPAAEAPKTEETQAVAPGPGTFRSSGARP